MIIRLLRLYRSEKGIWRYEIERDGKIYWSSLRTRDKRKAVEYYERYKESLERGQQNG